MAQDLAEKDGLECMRRLGTKPYFKVRDRFIFIITVIIIFRVRLL